jgi:hypothetical protein
MAAEILSYIRSPNDEERSKLYFRIGLPQYKAAHRLRVNWRTVTAIAEALMKYETLGSKRIRALYFGAAGPGPDLSLLKLSFRAFAAVRTTASNAE